MDKSKMKLKWLRDIKDVREERKSQMERIYEKSCGSKVTAQKGVVDEVETTEEV